MKKFCLTICLWIILLLTGAFSLTSYGFAQNPQQQTLWYIYYDQDIRNGQHIMILTLDGETAPFIEGLFLRSSISRNRDVILTQTLDYDFHFYNADGELLATYYDDRLASAEWIQWNWFDNHSPIFVHQTEEGLTFYKLDYTNIAAGLQPNSDLNNAFIWNTDRPEDQGPLDVIELSSFQFSPDLIHVLTLASLPTTTNFDYRSYRGDQIALWDLSTPPDEPVEIITDAIPWWLALFVDPRWSHSSDQFVLGQLLGREDASLGLYVHDVNGSSRLLSEIECPTEDFCLPLHFAWSFDDTKIAYWQSPSSLGEARHNRLVIVDANTGEQRFILEDQQLTSFFFWSHDDQLIAFEDAASATDENGDAIRVIDAVTGDTRLLQSFDTRIELRGWLNSP